MCVATPVKIKSQIFTSEGKACKSKFQIEDGRIVDVSLVPDCKVGDWLLCHADLAINKLEEKEAKEILKISKVCHHHADSKKTAPAI